MVSMICFDLFCMLPGYISEEATAPALEVLSTHKENIPEECAATASQISSPNDSIPLEALTTASELPDVRKCDKYESGWWTYIL